MARTDYDVTEPCVSPDLYAKTTNYFTYQYYSTYITFA